MHEPSERNSNLPSDEVRIFVNRVEPRQAGPTSSGIDRSPQPVDRESAEAFTEFWEEHLHRTVDTRRAIAVLHDGSRERWFEGQGSEANWNFIERIRRESRVFGAVWCYIALQGEAAIGDDRVFDPTNAAQVTKARQPGDLISVTNWYAGTNTGIPEVFGIIHDVGGETRIIRSTYVCGADPTLRRILG